MDHSAIKIAQLEAEVDRLNKQLDQHQISYKGFEAIFYASDVAQKIIDSDLTILQFNQSMIDLLGYSKEELKGTKILDYTHPDFKERWHHLQVALWNHEVPNFQLEACLLKKDGTEIWCSIHTILFRSSDETFGHTILEDITIRKQLERHKDDFVSVVAHELRTPLTTIKSQAQLLERGLDNAGSEQMRNFAKGINKHVGRLTRIIDNLVGVSRIENEITQSLMQSYDLSSVISDAVADIQNLNAHREFKMNIEKALTLYGDEDKVRQVLYNLINNAIKFSQKDTSIHISLKSADNQAMVCIKDHGQGIPDAELELIFKRFYRTEQTINLNLAGMGFGLYISEQIVKQQGGRLWVESKAGEGATFCFTLPVLSLPLR